MVETGLQTSPIYPHFRARGNMLRVIAAPRTRAKGAGSGWFCRCRARRLPVQVPRGAERPDRPGPRRIVPAAVSFGRIVSPAPYSVIHATRNLIPVQSALMPTSLTAEVEQLPVYSVRDGLPGQCRVYDQDQSVIDQFLACDAILRAASEAAATLRAGIVIAATPMTTQPSPTHAVGLRLSPRNTTPSATPIGTRR
jgi:hypothetical protein